MSNHWSAGTFLAKARELCRRLQVWHIEDFRHPVQFASQEKSRRWVRLTFREILARGATDPRPRPDGGLQFFRNEDGKPDKDGSVGIAYQNPDEDTDRSLTQWLMGDFLHHLEAAETNPALDYLKEVFGHILDLPAWIVCDPPESMKYSDGPEDEAERWRYMVTGRPIPVQFLDNLTDAAQSLLRSAKCNTESSAPTNPPTGKRAASQATTIEELRRCAIAERDDLVSRVRDVGARFPVSEVLNAHEFAAVLLGDAAPASLSRFWADARVLGVAAPTLPATPLTIEYAVKWLDALISDLQLKEQTMAKPAQQKVKVLFFAANPDGTGRLALDEEAREIKAKIRSSEYRDSLELLTEWATRPDDLLQFFNQHKPHAVHFSGHGSKAAEIVLLDRDRQPKPVSVEALTALFQALKGQIRLVFLNACFSELQAEAIVQEIDCAVGMSQGINDKAAITFAASFYRALGFGKSVQNAFDQGKVALQLEGFRENDTPRLLTRKGVDPAKVVLVAPL